MAKRKRIKESQSEKKPKVHDEIKGFDIKINALGGLEKNIDIDKINNFLNENIKDKKFEDRAEEE